MKKLSLKPIRRYWDKGLMLLGLTFIALGLAAFFTPQPSSEIEIIPAEKEEEKEEIVVDIEGMVVKPGIYKLPWGARVNDLIMACNGFATGADLEWVARNLNKAAILTDGAKIYIPKIGENPKQVKGAKTGLVNINQADASLLETLPGIGRGLAQEIIGYRDNHGGFKSIEELMAVSGIGSKTFNQIKDKITLF